MREDRMARIIVHVVCYRDEKRGWSDRSSVDTEGST